MAHSLNISVMAEGVEAKNEKDFLLENNCDQIQGYYYSCPKPIDEFEEFVLALNIPAQVHLLKQ